MGNCCQFNENENEKEMVLKNNDESIISSTIYNSSDMNFSYEKNDENTISSTIYNSSDISFLYEKKYDEKFNYNYLKINDNLNSKLEKLLRSSINQQQTLNDTATYERQEVQKQNKKIYIKIKQKLSKYKGSEKKANYLLNLGYLIRFSHEIGIFMILILLDIFKKDKNNHSSKDIRLSFSKWIKEIFNENCFEQIVKDEETSKQINNLFDKINNEEKEFFLSIFPDLIKLYFICYIADMKVEIHYAKKDEEFDWENMVDDLLTMEENKKVLFTYLPGLFCNNQYFENSRIYVVTYPKDNPKKFKLDKPVFEKNVEFFTI